MKKIYSLICASAFVFASANVSATVIPVSITNNMFTPTSFTATVGDVVTWTLNAGTHTVTSQTVPSGAASFNQTLSSVGSTFSYTITAAGNYGYICNFHFSSGMAGGFSASTTVGISEHATDLLTTAYPNPFTDRITIQSKGIKLIDVYNIVGEKIKSVEVAATESKTEIDFANLPSGIYFYRTYRDGLAIETRKIVKTK